jgi:dTDP-4-dehydrorhamnose 3,5-epimerase
MIPTVTDMALDGVKVITSPRIHDDRGFFSETYHTEKYAQLGVYYVFVQDNHSRSRQGAVRGIHFQDTTAPMAKLVRCLRGAILDVAVDLRIGSPTLAHWVAVELSEDNALQLLIPEGFGHGFSCLSEVADVEYKCTALFNPHADCGIRWNDPDLGIDWMVAEPVVSAKDAAAQTFKDYLQGRAFHLG